MTAAGRITSTRVTLGLRLRVEPCTVGTDQRPSFWPARNLRDSVDATVTEVARVMITGRSRRAQSRVSITVRTDDGRVLTGHYAPAETQRLAK